MAEKILVFNAKSCTVVDQYLNCTWVCLDLFWGCYGAICTEQSALLVNGPSEVQELQAILMVPNVALFPPGEVPEQPKKERNKNPKYKPNNCTIICITLRDL